MYSNPTWWTSCIAFTLINKQICQWTSSKIIQGRSLVLHDMTSQLSSSHARKSLHGNINKPQPTRRFGTGEKRMYIHAGHWDLYTWIALFPVRARGRRISVRLVVDPTHPAPLTRVAWESGTAWFSPFQFCLSNPTCRERWRTARLFAESVPSKSQLAFASIQICFERILLHYSFDAWPLIFFFLIKFHCSYRLEWLGAWLE